MTVGSLFSGIGGFDLGLERAGMTIKWQVEIDDFCNKVLEKHWPDVKRYRDIKELRGDELEPVDLICGGFPCQPFSAAGKRRSKEDDRYLWPEMLRVIRAVRPNWIIGENVAGIVSLALDDVLSDLESEGYACQSFIIPACAVNAPHRRDRVWIIAHARQQPEGDESRRLSGEQQHSGETKQRSEEGNRPSSGNQDATDSDNSRSRTSRDGDNREWQEKNKGQERFSQRESGRHGEASSNTQSAGTGLDERQLWGLPEQADKPNATPDTEGSSNRGKLRNNDGETQKKPKPEEQHKNETRQHISISGNVADTQSKRLEGYGQHGQQQENGQSWSDRLAQIEESYWQENWIQVAASLCRVDDGLPRRMDRAKRLKALGNAVVPQIVEIIGKAIMQTERR